MCKELSPFSRSYFPRKAVKSATPQEADKPRVQELSIHLTFQLMVPHGHSGAASWASSGRVGVLKHVFFFTLGVVLAALVSSLWNAEQVLIPEALGTAVQGCLPAKRVLSNDAAAAPSPPPLIPQENNDALITRNVAEDLASRIAASKTQGEVEERHLAAVLDDVKRSVSRRVKARRLGALLANNTHGSYYPLEKRPPLPTTGPRNAIVVGISADWVGEFAAGLSALGCYAALQGYALHIELFNLQPDRGLFYYTRTRAVAKYLPLYDWVLHLGSDVVVANRTKRLEEYIDDRFDLILNDRENGEVHADGYLIKNSE
jgi:hypothetical protein